MICSFGGTFDPIHLGHVAAAKAASAVLGDVPVNLILSARPSHRDATGATIAQRLHMLELACAESPLLHVDQRECFRDKPSYTVDTLLELQQEHPGQPLVWIIGSDAYHYLPTWYRWQEVLQLAHLLVLDRVGHTQPPDQHTQALLALESQHRVSALVDLLKASATGEQGQTAAGCIYHLPVQLPDISATGIRRRVRQGLPVAHLLPAGVAPYIRQQQLYTAASSNRLNAPEVKNS